MRYLLDTCVLAALTKPGERHGVRRFLRQTKDEDLFVSVLVLGEIAKGVALLDESRRKAELAGWLSEMETRFAGRILPIGNATAHIWAELTAWGKRAGSPVPVVDGLIAATALEHRCSVVTRNVRHFRAAGVRVENPWEGDA